MKSEGRIDRTVGVGLNFFQTLLGDYHPRNFAVRLWDATTWEAEPGEPTRFTLVIRDPGGLRRMFCPPSDIRLGEAFIHGDFDVEGDIHGIFALRDHIAAFRLDPKLWLSYGKLLLTLPRKDNGTSPPCRAAALSGECHSRERDRQAVTFHYDVSNDFYRLWLDSNMIYSCAYFKTTEDDLDTAQERKLDYICRKLRLHSGERLLDIGCGWGGMVIHAARHYGVKALGITLSRPQAELANERIRDAGLGDRCRVVVRDYRDLDEPESFDKLVSIGMFEHVGHSRLKEYFRRAWRLLKPGGVFLNHGISHSMRELKHKGPSFVDTYVFPDSELLPISIALRVAELSRFEVRDVESLREHYAITLRNWVHRLEARKDEVCRVNGEAVYRIWRLYMAGSAHAFATGQISVFQALLAKPDRGNCRLPLTRKDWYEQPLRPDPATSPQNP